MFAFVKIKLFVEPYCKAANKKCLLKITCVRYDYSNRSWPCLLKVLRFSFPVVALLLKGLFSTHAVDALRLIQF